MTSHTSFPGGRRLRLKHYLIAALRPEIHFLFQINYLYWYISTRCIESLNLTHRTAFIVLNSPLTVRNWLNTAARLALTELTNITLNSYFLKTLVQWFSLYQWFLLKSKRRLEAAGCAVLSRDVPIPLPAGGFILPIIRTKEASGQCVHSRCQNLNETRKHITPYVTNIFDNS